MRFAGGFWGGIFSGYDPSAVAESHRAAPDPHGEGAIAPTQGRARHCVANGVERETGGMRVPEAVKLHF